MIFDPILMVIAIAFMVIGMIANNRLKGRFREYSLSQISSGFSGKHVASAAVAAQECGHAVQHATAYTWLNIRLKLVPVVNFSSRMMNKEAVSLPGKTTGGLQRHYS